MTLKHDDCKECWNKGVYYAREILPLSPDLMGSVYWSPYGSVEVLCDCAYGREESIRRNLDKELIRSLDKAPEDIAAIDQEFNL